LIACSLFHQGAFDRALEHAEQGLAAWDGQYFNPATAAYGDDPGAACHSWAALALWFLGYPDLARQRAGEAVALARDPHRRHGYATTLAQAAIVEQCRLDAEATRANAQATMEAAIEAGYQYRLAMATVLNGWATAALGSPEDGIAEIERGLVLSRETGARMHDPYFFALLADACTRAGRIEAAWTAVEAGLAHVPPGRRFFFESELHRLAGELLLHLDRPDEARVSLRKALDLAQGHNSPSLELRAALSLAGHFRSEGQDDAARGLTAGVYSRFTEGFETHDLVAARDLLEQPR
jgi:tetratricopeptide (TPR) repeat protein